MCFLSIVIPVYDEEENVRLLFEKIQTVCESLEGTYEVLFVDDGSRDNTFTVLSELSQKFPQVGVVRFKKNAGQTAAMAAGFEFAQGQWIISMDGDLQNDPVDIPKLLEKLGEGYDLVCGWRKARQDKFLTRRIPSIVANWVIAKVTGVPIHDNGCSLKAYRASIIKRVPLYGEMHRFIPAMSTIVGARIAEIIVTHHPRKFGKSKYGLARVWRVMLDIIAFKSILSVFSPHPKTRRPSPLGRGLQHSYSQKRPPRGLRRLRHFFLFQCKRRPLRFLGPIGVTLFTLGSMFLIGKLFRVNAVMNVSFLFFIGGMLTFCFGMFGELISFACAEQVKEYHVETVLRTNDQ